MPVSAMPSSRARGGTSGRRATCRRARSGRPITASSLRRVSPSPLDRSACRRRATTTTIAPRRWCVVPSPPLLPRGRGQDGRAGRAAAALPAGPVEPVRLRRRAHLVRGARVPARRPRHAAARARPPHAQGTTQSTNNRTTTRGTSQRTQLDHQTHALAINCSERRQATPSSWTCN